MKGVEILSRDGTARYGRLTVGEQALLFPSATDTTEIFPALNNRAGTSIPPADDPGFISRFLVRDGNQPIPVHVHSPTDIQSGETVIAPNWHTLLSRPRDFCQLLDELRHHPSGYLRTFQVQRSLKMRPFSFMQALISLTISQPTLPRRRASSASLTGNTRKK